MTLPTGLDDNPYRALLRRRVTRLLVAAEYTTEEIALVFGLDDLDGLAGRTAAALAGDVEGTKVNKPKIGRPIGTGKPQRRLTPDEIAAIPQLIEAGETHKAIAARFGCSVGAIVGQIRKLPKPNG